MLSLGKGQGTVEHRAESVNQDHGRENFWSDLKLKPKIYVLSMVCVYVHMRVCACARVCLCIHLKLFGEHNSF